MEAAAETSHTWRGLNLIESTSLTQNPRVYQLREEDSITAKLALVTRKLDILEANESKALNQIAKVEAQVCSSCGRVDHKPNECLMYVGEVEQDNALVFFFIIGLTLSTLIPINNNGKMTQTLVGGTTYPFNPMSNGNQMPNLVLL